jgi:hypothetical protein
MSGTTPNLRHQASGRRHRHHHVICRDRERYDLVDDHRDLATGTPRGWSRALNTAAATNTGAVFGI